MLCGCRADSRSDIEVISYLAHAHKLPITTEQAIKASQYISATAFAETSSSFVNQGVNEAFEVAAEAALDLLNENNCSPKKVSCTRNLEICSVRVVVIHETKLNLIWFDFFFFTEKVLGKSESDPNENQQIATNQKQHWQSWKKLLHHVMNLWWFAINRYGSVASHKNSLTVDAAHTREAEEIQQFYRHKCNTHNICKKNKHKTVIYWCLSLRNV